MRGKEGGGRAAASSRVPAETDIFFRSIGSQSASIHPPSYLASIFTRSNGGARSNIYIVRL